MNILQDKLNSNVYSASVGDYELQVRVEFPLKGVVVTTVEDALEGRRRGTWGLLTLHHECDGQTLIAKVNLRRNDALVASATLFLRNDESWFRFADYAKCPNLVDKFVEVAHEVVERWIANEFDNTWSTEFANSITSIKQATRLDDAVDKLNGIIATLERIRRLVPVVAQARGDSDKLGEQSFSLSEAHRFLGDVVPKTRIVSVSEVKQIAKKLADILAVAC
jgi:hypothetical protein